MATVATLVTDASQGVTVFVVASRDDSAVRLNSHFEDDLITFLARNTSAISAAAARNQVAEILATEGMMVAVARQGVHGPMVGVAVLSIDPDLSHGVVDPLQLSSTFLDARGKLEVEGALMASLLPHLQNVAWYRVKRR